MIIFLVCFSAGSSCLLSFLLFVHPVRNNVRGNQLLGVFAFTLGLAFMDIYLRNTEQTGHYRLVESLVNLLRFASAPALYLSLRFFVEPLRRFRSSDLLHLVPLAAFAIFRLVSYLSLEAYILPLQMLLYVIAAYVGLIRHRANLKLITSAINETDLAWLRNFLLILLVDIGLWLNEIYFNIRPLVSIDPLIYTGSIYFLAYYAIRQPAIYYFPRQELAEIAGVFEQQQVALKAKRLNGQEIADSKIRLDRLMNGERIYLDNELNLPQVAQKLGMTIHDASFLINEVAGESFYNFINRYRVEEAKRLLQSGKLASLNMLGIAFAAGFSSKTTFNTTFKKSTGLSPTQFAQQAVRSYPAEQR